MPEEKKFSKKITPEKKRGQILPHLVIHDRGIRPSQPSQLVIEAKGYRYWK